MIIFKNIRVRNFISYGNAWTELDFLSCKNTLVSGKSGSGKSALNLDAVCFVLFNRAYRAITKPELLNDTNNKQLEVEISLSAKGKDYRIRRGMKPAVFEIYEDGELIDQDAKNLDYQEHLEQVILGMTYKTFTQIAVIGSANYEPFMQLSTANRREVIEDLLNIKVFSAMNQILKSQVSENKKILSTIESDYTLSVDRTNLQKSYVKTLEKDNSDRLTEIDSEVSSLKQKLESSTKTLTDTKASYLKILGEDVKFDASFLRDKQFKLSDVKREIASNKKKLSDTEKYVFCGECGTPVDDEHRNKHLKSYAETIATLEQQLSPLNAEILILSKKFEEDEMYQKKLESAKNEIRFAERDIAYIQSSITSKNNEKTKYAVSANIEDEKIKLKDLAKIVVKNMELRATNNEEKLYLDAMTILLKDSGIKSTIIQQYIPIINSMVNKYLEILDLFVTFELNENFEESIKVRHRDNKKYDSFSEGEKQRIDLALLFAWRDIAAMNNSMSTNLLVMDEIFDKSLDSDGIDMALNILETVKEGTNVFVISHRGEALEASFDRHITVKKINNYSELNYE